MAKPPTILITGANGQLGFELASLLAPVGNVVALDRAGLDLADPDDVVANVRRLAPEFIVNAGAYTAVDAAENDAAVAFAINGRAPGILADEARRLGSILVHYSTDYVFDGAARAPYVEDAPVGPLGVYGASKLAGEAAIAASGAAALVLRTSWIYGLRGKNFLLTMQRLANERDELRVVADQSGTPNWCRELAVATARMLAMGAPAIAERAGLYHMSSTGEATWFGFAGAILGGRAGTRLVPITTAEYPTPARRPAYGVFDTRKFERTFGFALPPWRTALERCLALQRQLSPN